MEEPLADPLDDAWNDILLLDEHEDVDLDVDGPPAADPLGEHAPEGTAAPEHGAAAEAVPMDVASGTQQDVNAQAADVQGVSEEQANAGIKR